MTGTAKTTERGLDAKLLDVFCAQFGEEYRARVTPETTMDDVAGWDSLSFLDLVASLEDAYGVAFTNDEAVQMFQLGHIQRIIRGAQLNLPHEDVANGCCLLRALRASSGEGFSIAVFSGSSTREGLLRPREAEGLLRASLGGGDGPVGWYNLSISGLVMAETLRLVEQVPAGFRGAVVVGTSPVIFGGCGVAEFERAVNYDRLPFASPRTLEILGRHGYTPDPARANVPISVELWVERYLKGRDLEELRYEPYIYPNMAPWPEEKYADTASILRYYNHSVLNHRQCVGVNPEFYHALADWRDRTGVPVCLVELTLHPRVVEYLEGLGGLASRHEAFLEGFRAERGVPVIRAVRDAGITSAEFRDPGHIDAKREAYTRALIEGVLTHVGG